MSNFNKILAIIFIPFFFSCNNTSEEENYWKYELITSREDFKMPDADKADIFAVDLIYPQLMESKISQEVNQYIQSNLFFYQSNDSLDLNAKIASFAKDLIVNNNIIQSQTIWNINTHVNVGLNSKEYCTLSFVYHIDDSNLINEQVIKYINYDTETLKEVRFTDLINVLEEERFNAIVQLAFREKVEMSIEDEFLDHNFTFPNNKFYVPYNFLMTAKGLTFNYRLEEISTDKTGNIELVVPYQNLEEVLTKKSKQKLKKYL